MARKSPKTPAAPRWWKNTYFLFGILMVIISLLGFVRGAKYIQDPGQSFTSMLPLLYLAAAAIFGVNGYVSHRAYCREYSEIMEERNNAKVSHHGE